MAARRGRFLVSTLSWQKNALIGLICRKALRLNQFSRRPFHFPVARSLCSSVAGLNVPGQDEKVEMPKQSSTSHEPVPSTVEVDLLDNILEESDSLEIPKAASSDMTPSIFEHEVVSKFINCMMWDGKKSLSQSILRKAFEEIKTTQLEKRRKSSNPGTVETDPMTIFLGAVDNVRPFVGVLPINRGGRVFQIPTPLPIKRRNFLAIKWLITAAREQPTNKNARMYQKLAKELVDAFNNEGTAIKKKQELHRRAEDNRAFAHYRWW